MKRYRYILLLSLLPLFSCVKEVTVPAERTLYTECKVTSSLPQAISYLSGRASAEDEIQIETVDLLVFHADPEETRVETFLWRKSFTDEDIASGDLEIDRARGTATFSFDMVDDVHITKYGRTMVFYNFRDQLDEAFESGKIVLGTTREAVHTMFEFDPTPWHDTSLGFPAMPACGIGTSVIRPSYDNRQSWMSVHCYRPLARIDIGVDYSNNSSSLRNIFQINRVYMCSFLEKGYVVRHFADPLYSEAQTPNIPPDNTRILDLRTYVDFETNKGFLMERAAYMPESDMFDISEPYKLKIINPDGTIEDKGIVDPEYYPYNCNFLIIEATYNGQPNCFYRIDLRNSYEVLPSLRNHAYKVNVRQVKTPGYPTIEDAALDFAQGSGIVVDFVIEDEIYEDIEYFVFNDLYLIGINKNEISVDRNGGIFNGNNGVKVLSTYNIVGKEPWEIVQDPGSDWCIPTKTPRSEQDLSNLDVEVIPNDTGLRRECNLRLRAGVLEIIVRVVQSS